MIQKLGLLGRFRSGLRAREAPCLGTKSVVKRNRAKTHGGFSFVLGSSSIVRALTNNLFAKRPHNRPHGGGGRPWTRLGNDLGRL